MLKNISQILIGLSIFSPVILAGQLFFPFITGKAIFFRILIELALLIYVLHVLLSQSRKEEWRKIVNIFKNPVVLALSAFLVIFLITAFSAVNPTQAFWSNFERSEGAFQLIHYYLFFILALLLFQKKKDFEKLLLASLISAVYAAVYGLLQWLSLHPRFGIIGDNIRISGTLGNASYLAAFMLFAIGFLLYFLIKSKNRGIQILGSGLILFFLLMLFKTGTRGALLGLLVGGLAFLLSNVFRKNSTKWLKNTSLILVLLGVIFTATFFATHRNPVWKEAPIINRYLQLERAIDEFQPRIWSWNSALQGFRDKPILGWGPENYAFVYDKYYDARNYGRESFFDRVHNLYLENLVSGGALLFLAHLLVLIFLFREILRKKKDLWFSILLAIPIAYAVQAFFLFDVLVIYISFYLLIALVLNKDIDDKEAKPLKLNNLQLGLIMFTSLALLLNVLFIQQANLVLPLLILLAITIFYKKSEQEYFISVLDGAIALVLIFLTTASIYATAYKPLEKNKVLVSTFATNDINQKLSRFQDALIIKSPVGQEETVGMLNNFLLELSQRLEQNPNISAETLDQFIALANGAHDANADILPGLRHHYTNGGYNLRLGYSFDQPQLRDRGKQIYYSALEKSPTRIEFLILLIEAARLDNDEEEYERLRQKAIELRPDLVNNWPEFSQVKSQ